MRQCPSCGKRFLTNHVAVCDVDGSALQELLLASAKDRLVGAVILEQYRIDGVLGDGGMGVVYSARHVRDARRYAVKVLRAEYSDEEDLVKRFQQEAEAVRDIRHPNIIEVFQFGTLEDGSRFFVMEYLEGRSLGQLLAAQPRRPGRERRRALPEALTIHIAEQICSGLAAAHERGIVHRDMKPDNIHLIRRGEDDSFVKILDFGIAKVQGSKSARTRTGSVFGTPHYMSPEQASGERDIDARTDIYALGVLLYEMTTGKVPFDADNLMGILTAHLYHPPVPPREHPEAEGLSRGLEAIILKALSKRREHRYATMRDLREDLLRVSRGEAPAALDDERTQLFRRPPSSEDFEPRSTTVDKRTVPEGRISRVPVAGLEIASEEPTLDDVGDPTEVNSREQLAQATPVLPVGTGRSIPPVTGSVSRSASLPDARGVPALRSRSALIAVLFGAGALLSIAAAVVMGMRRQDVRAAPVPALRPAAPVPRSNATLAPAALGQGTPPSAASSAAPETPSREITLMSDPSGAVVLRGRERLGITPLAVPRPSEGEVVYTLSAEGRMRTSVTVRSTSARELQVVLPALGRTRPAGSPSSEERSGTSSPDLLNPWGNEHR